MAFIDGLSPHYQIDFNLQPGQCSDAELMARVALCYNTLIEFTTNNYVPGMQTIIYSLKVQLGYLHLRVNELVAQMLEQQDNLNLASGTGTAISPAGLIKHS